MRQYAPLLALLALPLAVAHDDLLGPGTPDLSCQTPAEWRVHDYAPPAQADTLAAVDDGNIEECGTTFGFTTGAQECRELEDRYNLGPGDAVWELVCNTDRPLDFDGDFEFAVGGALLSVESGDGATSGSLVCYGALGHHPAGGPVRVQDNLVNPVAFSVGADASLLPPPPGMPDCGDGTIVPCPGFGCNPDDHLHSCPIQNNGVCNVPFGPGADGAYYVFVGRMARPAVGGHVIS